MSTLAKAVGRPRGQGEAGCKAKVNSKQTKKARLTAKEGWALRLRGSLLRIGEWRKRNGVITDINDDVAGLIADAAVFTSGGLSPTSFASLARRMGLRIQPDIAKRAIDNAFDKLMRSDEDLSRYWLPSAEKIGRLLGLTKHERHLIEHDLEEQAKTLPPPKITDGKKRRHVTTISAAIGLDETVEEVQAERDERRVAKDQQRRRETKRKAYKARHERERRAKAGAIPRAEYEGNSARRTEPWKALGVSESTWRRRGKPMPPADRSAWTTPAKSTTENTREIGDRSPWTACHRRCLSSLGAGADVDRERDTRPSACAPARVPPDEARTRLSRTTSDCARAGSASRDRDGEDGMKRGMCAQKFRRRSALA